VTRIFLEKVLVFLYVLLLIMPYVCSVIAKREHILLRGIT